MSAQAAGSLACLCMGSVVGAVPLELVRDGKSTASLVVAGDAPPTVARAAAELQEYVERSTGARLPILTDRRPEGGISVFVGESRFTRALGISLDGVGPDGYRWLTAADWIAIVGRDYRGQPIHGMRNPWQPHEVYNPQLKLGAFGEAGTLSGADHFLERFLGVRWFMPGDLGTVVPKHADLFIPPLDLTRAPDFEYRYPWFCNFDIAPDDALWFRHVGFGGVAPVQAIDSFRMFLKYKDDHPDWFALVDGERDFASLCCVVGGGNLCLSNEALLQQMAADIGAYFDEHPDQRFFPVAPNDGMTRVCGCERCAPQVQPDRGEAGCFSDYFWGFVNRLAAEVARTHPGRFLGTIAYEGYRDPPDNLTRLHPNVAVMLCQTRGSFADADHLRKARELVNAWRTKTDRLYLWEYYRYNLPPFPWCPVAYPHLIAADLAFLKGASRGEFIESESWRAGEESRIHYPAMQHLNLYVTAKCLWDADLDVDALLQDYVTSFYGPAAGPMAAFWKQAEALHAARPLATEVMKYPLGDLDSLLKLLADASAATAPETDYRRRVALVQSDVQKLRDTLSTPLVTKAPEMDCCLAAGPVQLDGALDDPGWRNALPQGFVLKNGEAPPYHSWLVSTHDAQHLYLGIVNVEPRLGALGTLAGPDHPEAGIWDDDCVEVFVSPDAANPKRAYQLIVNAAGKTWDGAYGLPEPGLGLFGCQPAWDCQGLRVAVGKTGNRWTVELAIPLQSVGLSGAALPDRVALNVYRCRRCGEAPVYTGWSPPLAEQHYAPERFGTLWLKATNAPPRETARLVPLSTDDVGSGAASGPGWYTPGGVLDGKPFVGNPNTLLRRDRMVLRFDLAPLALTHGERGVKSATLRLFPVGFSGPDDTRLTELSHLQYDTAVLNWKDIVNDSATVVGVLDARRNTALADGLTYDVTKQVNADLALGRPAVSFRLRDLASEEGNPEMKPDGLCFPDYRSGNLRLEVE
ncbi:MAG: hypothetical protein AUJ96_09780 [Armatimonadetes bacterium CG2_30_66_41]|nr:DUF4838 domain-containing protein [Armatimonadota bacterium]OIP05973.1 MAG: hypothetical protein AUJ96_09780 [Armatimonadetes bacterium CG2_30_66_41]